MGIQGSRARALKWACGRRLQQRTERGLGCSKGADERIQAATAESAGLLEFLVDFFVSFLSDFFFF